ncbi:MAG: flavin reductase family protein [candidate division Zixibacteria bacterium]|nr:flavin reductase family protein [candidate division Zixibacteria bacterium]
MSIEISKVLRKLEYGVYVVSVGKGNDGNAFCASWVSQVSSEPPMVALAVHNKHQSSRMLNEHRCFVVNLLGEGQEAVAKTYYGPAESGYEKLRAAIVRDSAVTGSPVINGAVAYLDCKVVKAVPAGNHTLFLAEVVGSELGKDVPILTSENSKLKYAG